MNRHRIIHEMAKMHADRPFEWGPNDCIHFAASVAVALTGRDPIPHIRGRYDSEIGCRRGMIEEGWKNYADAAASCFQEIPVAMARTGDWATFEIDGVGTVGIFLGHQVVAKSQTGVAFRPLSVAEKAFRVE